MLSQLVKEHPYYIICCYVGLLLWFLLVCWALCNWCKNKSSIGIPPGNRGLPFVGETLQFMAAINSSKGVYEFVHARSLRYGKCFKAKLFGETHVFISSTESAKVIVNKEKEGGKFSKRYIKSIAELVGRDSLLCAAEQHHKLIRARLFTLFSTDSLSSFVQLFDSLVLEATRTWTSGSVVVIQDETLKLACKAMCKMLISIESGHELVTMHNEVTRLCEAMLALPVRLPWTRFYKGLQARKRIMNILEKNISERRSGIATHHVDFLQQLLDNKLNEDGVPGLTDREIKDNILTMIIAGQDTIANAMTWMIKFVDENRQVFNTLMKEQLKIEKNGSRNSYLTLEALNEMPYASKVVKEALRKASVVQWLPRVALEDCVIEGFKIKKGWNINIDARSIHHDPTVHKDPDVFNPSRFPAESKPYSFLAFGMGGRTCLGKNMAKAMMLVFLHRFITNYKWKVIDSDSSIQKRALFTKLKSGYPVRLISKKDAKNKTM